MRSAIPFLLLACTGVPCHADGGDVTLMTGPVVGGAFEATGGENLDIGAAPALALAVHIDAPAGGQYELYYSRQRTDIATALLFSADAVVDLDIDYLQVGGNIAFGDARTWQPYALLTVGGARFDPRAPGTRAETFFAMSGGLGLYRELGARLALRIEGRAFASWVDADTDVFCVSAGGAICAISSEGDSVWQWAGTVGLAWRF